MVLGKIKSSVAYTDKSVLSVVPFEAIGGIPDSFSRRLE